MSWYLAPSLVQHRAEVDQRWPDRDRRSDGTIGDPAHQAQGAASDHNPNQRESVNASDTDADGIDPHALVTNAIGDRRTNYVIFDRQIWSRSHNFVPRPYTGGNPHTGHVHISILQTEWAEQDTTPWGLAISDTDTTEEDALSAEAEARIIAAVTGHVDAALADMGKLVDAIPYRTKEWPVTRGQGTISWIQDTVNGTSNTVALRGQMAGLTKAVEQLAAGQGLDLTGVAEAARAGAEAGALSMGDALEATLRAVLADMVPEQADAVVDEVAARLGGR